MRRVKPWLINSSAGLALAAGSLWAAPQLIDLGNWARLPEQAAESLSTAGLSVEQVLVTGRQKTNAADILNALGAVRGAPILEIDIPAAKNRITALPWVRSADIVRHLPNSLHIGLNEYTAFALWQRGARYTLIDRDGTAIIDVATAPPGMPVVVGADAPDHVDTLFAALSGQPDLKKRVKAAVRFGGRHWDLLLDAMDAADGGITIKLPESDVATAWEGLAALDAKRELLSRAIAEIDLRIAGRLTVQLRAGYAPLPLQSRYSPAEQDVRTDARISPKKESPKGV